MSEKFLFVFKLPAVKKGCFCIPIKPAAAICSILTIIYVIISFFVYYNMGTTQLNSQFYFFLIQVYAATASGLIFFSCFKDESWAASLGINLHT
jgi:hypothetical protein